jgi:hypothetical protein
MMTDDHQPYFDLVDTTPRAEVERIPVPAHATDRMTVYDPNYPLAPPWVFTFARTGCLRIQRGDFCAYLPFEVIGDLQRFLALAPEGHR